MTGLRTFYTQQQVFDEPTPRQTDFDSVVVTTWPRPVRLTREESECHFKVCPDIKKPWDGRFQTSAGQEEQILILLG
jgi:hypothetical protein